MVVMLATTSCGMAKLLRLSNQVDLIRIEKCELKGLTALQLVAEVRNDSKYDIEMESGVIELLSEGQRVATLIQVGVVKSAATSHESIKSLWKISDVDPFTMMMLSSKIANGSLDGLSVNYSATLSADKISHTISGKEVDIKKLLAIFAS